jgi:hypothetical protein
MNLETIIFNTVLVVLCIIPFILMGRFQQKRKNQLLKLLTDLAVTQNCKITYKEFCGEIAIGLDESNNFLFFMRCKKADIGEDIIQFVDLTKVKYCKLINTSNAVKTKEGSNTIIERLALRFSPIDDNQNDIVLDFYNKEEKWQLSGEFQLIEKWQNILKPRIKALA